MDISLPHTTGAEKALLHYARTHDVPCMSSATETYMLQHLMTYKPTICLEIGSAVGYSTSRIAHTIEQRGGSIYSFEVSHPSYMTALQHTRNESLWNVRLYQQSILYSPLHKLIPGPIDFVFIDGMKQEYAAYVKYILPYCHAHTTMICDDVIQYHDKIQPLYTLLDTMKQHYTTHMIETHDGILLIQNKALISFPKQ